jgi:hypothetical protein
MEQSQTQHGMRQSQYQGPERRQSQMPYHGTERRRLDWPFKAPRATGMSTQERKDEQAERAREQQKEQDDRI